MRGPQLEDGYTRIANEILEAIARFTINATQFRILMVIWRYTYGFNRKSSELSQSFIAEATGLHKKQVQRELNELIKMNIIKVEKEASFSSPRVLKFNKYYQSWEGANQLPPNEIDTCRGSELVTSPGNDLATSPGSELVTQERQYKDNIKDIEEDEEERVPSLEISDKVPSLCQEEDDPVLEFLNQVSSYYTTLTGRLTSPNDEVAITDIAKHTNDFELVKEAMDKTFKNYKPRYKGDKIRGFKYFVPGILEQIAIEKERQKRREVKVANGNDFLGTETERTPKFDKSKFLYQGNG